MLNQTEVIAAIIEVSHGQKTAQIFRSFVDSERDYSTIAEIQLCYIYVALRNILRQPYINASALTYFVEFRDEVKKHLDERGIEIVDNYQPLYQQ